MSELEATLRRVVLDLGRQKVRFAVVGGLAVSARSEPRFTRDADLCVAVEGDPEAEAVVRGLRAAGYELLALVEQEAVGRLATARLSDLRSTEGATVVGLLFASSGIEREVVEQAEVIELFDGLEAPVATVPALLALKVLARDDRTRPQDRLDALALLALASPEEVATTRDLLAIIERRGFARDRDLSQAFDVLLQEASA